MTEFDDMVNAYLMDAPKPQPRAEVFSSKVRPADDRVPIDMEYRKVPELRNQPLCTTCGKKLHHNRKAWYYSDAVSRNWFCAMCMKTCCGVNPPRG